MVVSEFGIVWLKRDLRLTDHQPLMQAMQWAKKSGAELFFVYLIEPELIRQADCSPQHYNFALESLLGISSELPESSKILLVKSDARDFFQLLTELKANFTIFSHEETGNWASFQRDKWLKSHLKKNKLKWFEYPSNGVVRGSLNRDNWSTQWGNRMERELYDSSPRDGFLPSVQETLKVCLSEALHKRQMLHVWLTSATNLPDWSCHTRVFKGGMRDKPSRQLGGRKEAISVLESFLYGRGQHYRQEMSSPLSAETSCSRISPYLTFGVLSIAEVLSYLSKRRIELQTLPAEKSKAWKQSLKSFESRLHWHCHFIQKLESEPELEFQAAHRGLNSMRMTERASGNYQKRLDAWIHGKTGFPMIDACMRMLKHTGWINFRMRAMLVSFASYQLWLDWRDTAPLLAREFLDYEPGIHYPQFQMQSGVTGINTLRIYNPVKQAQDHDPKGEFVKTWVQELAHLPEPWIFEPWKTPALVEFDLGLKLADIYRQPIVDPEKAISIAREKIKAFRSAEGFAEEAKRVYKKHGSRHPNRNGVVRRKPKKPSDTESNSSQLNLFD